MGFSFQKLIKRQNKRDTQIRYASTDSVSIFQINEIFRRNHFGPCQWRENNSKPTQNGSSRSMAKSVEFSDDFIFFGEPTTCHSAWHQFAHLTRTHQPQPIRWSRAYADGRAKSVLLIAAPKNKYFQFYYHFCKANHWVFGCPLLYLSSASSHTAPSLFVALSFFALSFHTMNQYNAFGRIHVFVYKINYYGIEAAAAATRAAQVTQIESENRFYSICYRNEGPASVEKKNDIKINIPKAIR